MAAALKTPVFIAAEAQANVDFCFLRASSNGDTTQI